MKPGKLWIIAFLLLVLHFILQYGFYLKVDFSNIGKITSFLIDLAGNMFLIIIPGLITGALLAIIPFKKMSYAKKLEYTFPLAAAIILLSFVVIYTFLVFYGNQRKLEQRPGPKYNDIRIPENLDCTSVHNGYFETENITIERTGDKQIQIHKKTRKKEEFKVVWESDCEYKIISVDDSAKALKVKITEVKENEYHCYVVPAKFPDRSAYFYKIRRIKGK